jgi:hypothetical protein
MRRKLSSKEKLCQDPAFSEENQENSLHIYITLTCKIKLIPWVQSPALEKKKKELKNAVLF